MLLTQNNIVFYVKRHCFLHKFVYLFSCHFHFHLTNLIDWHALFCHVSVFFDFFRIFFMYCENSINLLSFLNCFFDSSQNLSIIYYFIFVILINIYLLINFLLLVSVWSLYKMKRKISLINVNELSKSVRNAITSSYSSMKRAVRQKDKKNLWFHWVISIINASVYLCLFIRLLKCSV